MTELFPLCGNRELWEGRTEYSLAGGYITQCLRVIQQNSQHMHYLLSTGVWAYRDCLDSHKKHAVALTCVTT